MVIFRSLEMIMELFITKLIWRHSSKSEELECQKVWNQLRIPSLLKNSRLKLKRNDY